MLPVNEVPAALEVFASGLPGRREGKRILRSEFADSHEPVEGGTAGGPQDGAARCRDVQGIANYGQVLAFDRVTD